MTVFVAALGLQTLWMSAKAWGEHHRMAERHDHGRGGVWLRCKFTACVLQSVLIPSTSHGRW